MRKMFHTRRYEIRKTTPEKGQRTRPRHKIVITSVNELHVYFNSNWLLST